MDKKLMLEACREIKNRKRYKLGEASGICGAVYCIITRKKARKLSDSFFSSEFDLIQREQAEFEIFVRNVALSLGYHFTSHYPNVDIPYKWTAKRRRLLDKLIEVLES